MLALALVFTLLIKSVKSSIVKIRINLIILKVATLSKKRGWKKVLIYLRGYYL